MELLKSKQKIEDLIKSKYKPEEFFTLETQEIQKLNLNLKDKLEK